MLALRVLIFLLCVAVLLAFIVQVAVPFVQGKRLFPAFRKKPPLADELEHRREAVQDLKETVEVTEDIADLTYRETRLQRELRELEAELDEVRKPETNTPKP